MFGLADMMTHIEVGAAMARKAVRLAEAGDSRATLFKAMSRIFAAEVSELVSRNSLRVLNGTGAFSPEAVDEFTASTGMGELAQSGCNIIKDMDRVADILFGR
jgi:alkylation response protein AidB-like acyl-CoA dehydrogenase